MSVNPIPHGYHSVTPYLVVEDARKLIEFLRQTFDAEVSECMERPDGRIMHAEARVGDSMIMMGEPMGEFTAMPASLYVYLPDCDAAYRRALEAGAVSVSEPADMFYGDRHGGVKDPCGNLWWVATHIEDLTLEEIKERAQAFGKPKS